MKKQTPGSTLREAIKLNPRFHYGDLILIWRRICFDFRTLDIKELIFLSNRINDFYTHYNQSMAA